MTTTNETKHDIAQRKLKTLHRDAEEAKMTGTVTVTIQYQRGTAQTVKTSVDKYE